MLVECCYVDTCFSCYLTDHHNRPGELLLGIVPHGQTESEAVTELYEEMNAADYGFPWGRVSPQQLRDALAEGVAGIDFTSEHEPGEEIEEMPYSWFVLRWEEL